MYLKQVELENFKSFGGKMVIPLSEGYWAITGPNGSGKSNITDAILFVLGPKSSKAVRAGKLTDLIFDGGKAGNRMKFTKVSLVFDNTDRLMPWDDDIVRLTRYVKISDNGVDYSSYFYINDRKSSLTEFDSLLTKARISADGYNMVQQGDVTRIVQMGNLERRRVVDSISGISSYDADIEKARSERVEAETNMDRINIVVEELEKQLERLEKDREDAKKYIETQKHLEMAKAQSVHRQLQIEEAKRESVANQITRLTAEIEKLNARKAEIVELYKTNEEAISSKEDEIAEKVGPEYREIKTKIENVRIAMATQKDRIERAEEDMLEQETFKAGFLESMHDCDVERKAFSDSLDDLRISYDNKVEQLNVAKADDAAISAEISQHGGEHTTLQNRLNELDSLIDKQDDVVATAAENKSSSYAHKDACLRSKANLEEKFQSSQFDIKDAEWNLQQVKAEVGDVADTESISKQILEKKSRESELEKQETELRDAIGRLDREYNELMVEKKASDRVNRGSAAVSMVLQLRDKGEMAGIHGTIQELATVDPGYETALGIAAGGKMQAVIVDDDQVASDCIAYLKREKLGRVTFLPLSKMIAGKPGAKAIMALKSTLGYATDLMDYDPRYESAYWYVFRDTLVVNTLNEARALMGGIRLVTKGGELIEASGAMVGGNINTQSVMKFGSASDSKLDEVGMKLRAANDSMEALRSQLREVRNEIRGLDDEMRQASTEGMGAQARIGELKGKVTELKRAKDILSEELKSKESEVVESEKAYNVAKEAYDVAKAKSEELRNERTVVRERIAQIAPAELQERIVKIREKVHKLTGMVADLNAQCIATETEITGIDKQKESLKQQVDAIELKIQAAKESIRVNTEEQAKSEVELKALRGIESDMESGIEDLRIQKDQLVERRYQMDSEKEAVQEKLENNSGILESNRAQAIIVEENISQLAEEIANISFEVEKPIPSEEEIRRTIRSCEGILSKIGNVNLRAIEDYDEKKKRYDGLVADVSALAKQIKELSELMDSLGSQKKGLFMQSYNAIHENFRSIYSQLSGGGEAYMGLENEEDPFTGGLQINAKPKNGKMLRLEALSGGEKSLTALAFIFAIQEYQPSPFYVLDEVDMFLDSVNAEMVAKRVKESSAKAQFLQVSLRKVTLALADHLIGVTRPPNGISKVIMQPDLAEVSKYEEQANVQNEETA